jgi:hypothetical protein
VSDNLYNFKKRVRPEDYLDGPCKVYSKEEIDEWTRTCYDKVYPSIEAQRGMTAEEIKFLDACDLMHAELQFNELLEGTRESNLKDE